MEKVKWLLSIIIGALVTFGKQYIAIIAFVCAAVVFDWITGVVKAKATGVGLNSKKASQGFWKKVALFVGLFFGFFLDYFIPYMMRYISIELPITCLFGMIFGCYIVINESLSILENIEETRPGTLPKWVAGMLTQTKEKIDGDIKEVVKNE